MKNSLVQKCTSFSKMLNIKWFFFLLLLAITAGCKKDNETTGIINPCPLVVSTDPMPNAVDVVFNKVISATFNTNMDPATINNKTFTIKQLSTSTFLSGTVAPTGNAATFTFTPDVP